MKNDRKDLIMPNPFEVDPLEKGTSYDKQFGDYFYNMWQNGGAAWKADYRHIIEENRTYWRGEQNPNQYKKEIYSKSSQFFDSMGHDLTESLTLEEKRAALDGINFNDIASPAPYIRNSIHGMLGDSDRKIKVKMIDLESIKEEENKKWRLWANKVFKKFYDAMFMAAGMENQEGAQEMPDTLEELEVLEYNEHFKLNQTKEQEKLLRDAENISNYKQLREKFIDDLACGSIAMSKVSYNPTTNKMYYEYLDPAVSCMQYSTHSDFRDSGWGFTIKVYSVSELASFGISTSDLKDAAYLYAGRYGNTTVNNRSEIWTSKVDYMDFKVPVMVAAYTNIDVYKSIKFIRANGRVGYKDVPFTTEEKDFKNGEKIVLTRVKNIREFKYVIDTNIIFDNGIMPFMPRKDVKEPMLPFRAVMMDVKPIVSSIKPFLNDFHLSWLWYQNAKAHMKMFGYEINIDLLTGIKDKDGNGAWAEAIKMWDAKGILPKSLVNAEFVPGTSSDKAITPISGGMGAALSEIIQQMSFSAQMISSTTGININSLEGVPDEGKTQGLEKAPSTGVSNALKYLLNKTIELKLDISTYANYAIINLLKNNADSRNAYSYVIGDTGVSLLSESFSSGRMTGTYLDAKTLSEERRDILSAAERALAGGRDGVPIIEMDEYLYIIESDELSVVRAYIRQKTKKKKEEIKERERINQEANAQIQNQAIVLKREQEQLVIDMKTKAELAIMSEKYDREEKLEKIRRGYDDRNDRLQDSPPPEPMPK